MSTSDEDEATYGGTNVREREAASPYPVSRLAPSFRLVDLARQLEDADRVLGAVASGKLHAILEQVRALQEQAKRVLEETHASAALHRAECSFKKRPGAVYHLYERPGGARYFSLLAPADWGTPPHPFVGSFRLEVDQSWTPLERAGERERDAAALAELVRLLPTGRGP